MVQAYYYKEDSWGEIVKGREMKKKMIYVRAGVREQEAFSKQFGPFAFLNLYGSTLYGLLDSKKKKVATLSGKTWKTQKGEISVALVIYRDKQER